jgi:hypothetical protein
MGNCKKRKCERERIDDEIFVYVPRRIPTK